MAYEVEMNIHHEGKGAGHPVGKGGCKGTKSGRSTSSSSSSSSATGGYGKGGTGAEECLNHSFRND